MKTKYSQFLLGMAAAAVLITLFWVTTTQIKSYSQAMNCLSKSGMVTSYLGILTYTSAKDILTPEELESLSKLSDVYEEIYIRLELKDQEIIKLEQELYSCRHYSK